MKKRLFDLSIQEFTYLLLDFEEVYEIEVRLIDNDDLPLAVYDIRKAGKVNFEESGGINLVKGTYSQLCLASAGFPELRQWIENNLFDYNMLLESIDVYNYLEYKTVGFNRDKIAAIINDMEIYHQYFREEMGRRAYDKYFREGKAIPQKKINSKLTHYQDEYLDDVDAMINDMLGLGAGFYYHTAIGLLKNKLKSKVSINTQNAISLPPELDTPRAREYLNRAQEAGLLDERYQPVKGVTNVQKKLFAAYCAVALNITERHWKVFENLWDFNGLQKVKEEQGGDTKAKAVAALFPSDVVATAKERFNLLV